jgi:hypothetical protein
MQLHRSQALIALALSLLLQVSAAAEKKPAPKKLAQEIEAVLNQPPLDRAHWGIDVVDVASGNALYSQNPEQLFLPASNTKLFTTAAALAIAGPDYRFRTTVEAEGKIDSHGRLLGDCGTRRPQHLRANAALCTQDTAYAAAHANLGRDGRPGSKERIKDCGWRPDRRRHVLRL